MPGDFAGGSVRIPKLIGVARMTDMMLTGRVYKAEEGERAGFAQYLVPAGQAFARAVELAKRIAENAPLTNYALMHALPRIAEQPADQGFTRRSGGQTEQDRAGINDPSHFAYRHIGPRRALSAQVRARMAPVLDAMPALWPR